MAALNFPKTPELNDTYTANGQSWTWNGVSWRSNATELAPATYAEAMAGQVSSLRSWSPVRVWDAIVGKLLNGVSAYLLNYVEAGVVVSPVAGEINITLDGRVYEISITAPVTAINVTMPTAPKCGTAMVYLVQDITGHAVTIPETWYTIDGNVLTVPTTPLSVTQLVLWNDAGRRIHANIELRSTPLTPQ
jgi:hypothetical protein